MAPASTSDGSLEGRPPGGDGLPVGRLVAVHGGGRNTEGTEWRLEVGELGDTLAIEGQPLGDLMPGTRLGIGEAVVLELTTATEPRDSPPARGLREAATGVCVGARVVTAGIIGVGDAVMIEAVPVSLEDVLDLHAFRPDEVAAVVGEYLHEAAAAGLAQVRFIHGRGRGVLRLVVRRILTASPVVAAVVDAPPEAGGWGATIAHLRRPGESGPT